MGYRSMMHIPTSRLLGPQPRPVLLPSRQARRVSPQHRPVRQPHRLCVHVYMCTHVYATTLALGERVGERTQARCPEEAHIQGVRGLRASSFVRLLGITQDLSVPAPIARYQAPHLIQNCRSY